MLDAVKDSCCGCAACANVCPAAAISMAPNNEGFLYPKIDETRCLNCSLCEKICPVLNPSSLTGAMPRAYAVQNKDDAVRENSTSGGAFSVIAEYVLDRGALFLALCSIPILKLFMAIYKRLMNFLNCDAPSMCRVVSGEPSKRQSNFLMLAVGCALVVHHARLQG